MCGIAGYINTNLKPIKDTSSIISMLRVQRHRGPDDSGMYAFSLKTGDSSEFSFRNAIIVSDLFEGVLGFNRLSILDLTTNGHQPMKSPDGKVLLTLNGEIYNAFNFKRGLEDWGYNFNSTTDTEVVLALYLRYGIEGMLERLNGMFSIVIVDLGRKQLFITRDRFGIKPMYYLMSADTLAFSSELKSFRYLESFSFKLMEDQVDEYLIFRNNLHGTLFEGIVSLDPGSFLEYNHESGLSKRKYFKINSYLRSQSVNGDLKNYEGNLRKSLSKSVSSQLMSDVKLGCQLSGGIDSSLITWFANKNSAKGNFESVSIIFENKSFNEESFIDIVARNLGITSHKFLLDANYYTENIEKATWHLEFPLNHPNTVAIYRLSQKAKEYVTVLLSGEGADEVFGGYSRYYDISFPYQLNILLREAKKNFAHSSDLISYFRPEYRAVMATAFMTPWLAKRLKPDFNKEVALSKRLELYQSFSGSLFDKQVKYELSSYLPDLLIRQDKMSMAHSIENRVPFLDNEVVEYSFSIPERYLLLRKSPEGYNTEKYILKKITAEIFGSDFAFRNKMGFGIPLKEFFLNKRSNEYLNDKILPGMRRRGVFKEEVVSSWFCNIKNLKYSELEALWVVVAFEIWASVYLDLNYEVRNTPY